MQTVLVTGGAGFIGYHCETRLLEDKNKIISVDNMCDYYTVELKKRRLEILEKNSDFVFENVDIRNRDSLVEVFKRYKPDIVVHLAAQAGVRYSAEHPEVYINTNVVGFFNVLDCCNETGVKNIVFASSSSVYGNSRREYFCEDEVTDRPESIYAATKKADEEIAHAMAKSFGLNIIGLRLFTVYGPWGRPDMAYFSFADAIRENQIIKVFNYGEVYRDYTYVGDVAEAICRLIRIGFDSRESGKFDIFNIAHGKAYSVGKLIECLENEFHVSIKKEYVGKQIGDVERTQANNSKLQEVILYKPDTDLQSGIHYFCEWYKSFYKL